MSILEMCKIDSCFVDSQTKFGLQTFLTKKFSDEVDNLIYQIVLNHALKAESKCSGTGIQVLKRFSGVTSEESSFENNRDSLLAKMKDVGLSDKESFLLMTAFDMSSFGGKISIKKSKSLTSFVEMHEGYRFDIRPALKVSNEFYNPHVLCIDGFIESVSEIHHILEWAADCKKVVLLFSRGYSDDVLHTIKVNNDRKSFTIIAFVVPFDQDNVNTLVDISVVSSSDVISSLKGDLISSIETRKISTVDLAIVNDDVIIRNDKSRSAVKVHLENLKSKMQDRPELESFISERIRSLSSRRVDVYLSDDIKFVSTSHKMDLVLRWARDRVVLKVNSDDVINSYVKSLNATIDSIGEVIV